MSYETHAARDLNLAGIGGKLRDETLSLIRLYSRREHFLITHRQDPNDFLDNVSPQAVQLANRLVGYQLLTPLGNPFIRGEFIDVSESSLLTSDSCEMPPMTMLQSTRSPSVFSRDGGITWYDLENPNRDFSETQENIIGFLVKQLQNCLHVFKFTPDLSEEAQNDSDYLKAQEIWTGIKRALDIAFVPTKENTAAEPSRTSSFHRGFAPPRPFELSEQPIKNAVITGLQTPLICLPTGEPAASILAAAPLCELCWNAVLEGIDSFKTDDDKHRHLNCDIDLQQAIKTEGEYFSIERFKQNLRTR